MSVWGSSLENARHWIACWRSRPERGRLRFQSAWSGRNGCVLKTTRRASTPRRRSACTFVQPTPARLTGQCVTRSGTTEVSGSDGEQEPVAVPAIDLAAVRAGEAGLDTAAFERSPHLGDLRAPVDQRAGHVARDGLERLRAQSVEAATRACGGRQCSPGWAAQRPGADGPVRSTAPGRDLERRSSAGLHHRARTAARHLTGRAAGESRRSDHQNGDDPPQALAGCSSA